MPPQLAPITTRSSRQRVAFGRIRRAVADLSSNLLYDRSVGLALFRIQATSNPKNACRVGNATAR